MPTNDKTYMREYMRKYNLKHAEQIHKIIHCGLCNIDIKQCNVLKHNKSIKHIQFVKNDKLTRYEFEEKIKELKEGFSKEELELLLQKKKLYEAIMESKQNKEV